MPWSLEVDGAGGLWIFAAEELDRRTSRFEGRLDPEWNWLGSTESVDWIQSEGQGPPEIHHLETFFYRDKLHLLRFRDRAYPVLQTRSVSSPVPFHLVNYPITPWRGFVSSQGSLASGRYPRWRTSQTDIAAAAWRFRKRSFVHLDRSPWTDRPARCRGTASSFATQGVGKTRPSSFGPMRDWYPFA